MRQAESYNRSSSRIQANFVFIRTEYAGHYYEAKKSVAKAAILFRGVALSSQCFS